MFEPVQVPKSDAGATHHTRSFQEQFFTFTPEMAAKETYDIIIIGTGIGGGILAADLFETNEKIGDKAKKVLVLEKGNLIFHSHCLNASRPAGLDEDRGQQNDTFFGAFKTPYTLDPNSDKTILRGGTMYCLGGRSAAWGLFSPRIHDRTLDTHFPKPVKQDLIPTFYKKAERLMNLSLPLTKPNHQHLLDRLNIAGSDYGVSWQWGRISSEFADSGNFDFAEGAYSTIDRLLEIAMSKPVKGQYYEYFKILLGVEARKINWKDGKTAESVTAVSLDGEFTFRLNRGGKVVLCAGSVASPAILLRSNVDLRAMGGCQLTDHDIMYKTRSFRYKDPSERKDVGAMKLQTYAKIGPKSTDIALLNMSLDASTFLPRSKAPYNDLPKLIIVFILWAPLQPDNNITLDNNGEPVVMIKRYVQQDMKVMEENMSRLTEASIDMVKQVLGVTFVDKDPDPFEQLGLGGVAHELGSIPMPNPSKNGQACLDQDLKLNGYEGVYVCDLSVFPYSPEANPTLTLAALAMRLSRKLVERETMRTRKDDTINIVNHSGNTVEVLVSNRKGKQEYKHYEMKTGDTLGWRRTKGCPECVFVFRIKPEWKPRNASDKPVFSDIPEFLVGNPGELLVIQ